MIRRNRFVHCVPVRISPVAVRVAVHAWSAIRAWDEASAVGQGTTEVGVVGRVRLSPQGAYRRPSQRLRAGLLNEGVWQKPRKSALLLK